MCISESDVHTYSRSYSEKKSLQYMNFHILKAIKNTKLALQCK